MTRSRRRLFLTVFAVVFLGGLGVSGASALWSQQATITAQVPLGTWVAEHSPTTTPTPSPTPTATPTPTPTPTASPAPTNQQWQWTADPALRAHHVSKGGSVTITLEWTAPAGQTVTHYVLEVPKSETMAVQSARPQAVVTIPNGNSCYQLRLHAVTSTGRSQVIERTLTFHPAGDGTLTIGLTDQCS